MLLAAYGPRHAVINVVLIMFQHWHHRQIGNIYRERWYRYHHTTATTTLGQSYLNILIFHFLCHNKRNLAAPLLLRKLCFYSVDNESGAVNFSAVSGCAVQYGACPCRGYYYIMQMRFLLTIYPRYRSCLYTLGPFKQCQIIRFYGGKTASRSPDVKNICKCIITLYKYCIIADIWS